MKYAHINNSNHLLGWYTVEVHSTIPTPNVVVTDEQWQTALDNNYNYINSDGSGLVVDLSTNEEKEVLVRESRDIILATVVDPLVSNPLRWADLTAAKKAEWSQYRTDLLNVPQQAGFPHTVAWPTKPEGE